jgi:NhaC family Na+:H+ antiporter
MNDNSKQLPLILALVPVIFLILFIAANVWLFEDTLEGSNQIVLILAAALASVIAIFYKIPWNKVKETIIHNIMKAMPAMLILLLIGSLAGTWLLSGVVPAMIFYGLKVIHPKVFLFTAVVTCGLISLATGSSWSTVATIGVALLGVGKALGFHEGIVAGAIISGAYFGDKMSPLSDTTNLAPAVSGTDLFTHIKYMTTTTVPSIILALLAFTIIGFTYNTDQLATNVSNVISTIDNTFFIHPILLLIPVILIIIIIKKVPPIPALLFGSLLGGVFAVIFQPDVVRGVLGGTYSESYVVASYKSIMTAMFGNIHIPSENEVVNELFSTSGMSGMLNTVWLILSAMVFGGAMDAAGMLKRITMALISLVRTDGGLIASTIWTSIFFNLTASDQYISIVVPGKMYAESYQKRKLAPELLSRTLEDGGTITSVLIPWNTCGATQSKVLGVSTWTYLPYCFFNIVNPIIAMAMGYLGYKIRKVKPDPVEVVTRQGK